MQTGKSGAHIIIANTQFKGILEYLQKALPQAFVEMVESSVLDQHIHVADVLIPTMAYIGKPLFPRAKKLKLVQQWGVGLEGVDIEAATAHGVAVANVPSHECSNADSVAEWCIMAAISLSRKFPSIMQQVHAGAPWGSPTGLALTGKTAGLVGFGGIGRALAQRLSSFGMRLVAVKRTPDQALKEQYGLEWLKGMAALPELLGESDYVFIGVPLRQETQGLIGAGEMAQMKSTAHLINAARGGLIDHDALVSALNAGRIGGAALDVFWKEPPDAEDPLLQCPGLIATPHIAGITDVSFSSIALRVAENINRVMRGDPPLYCVNAEKI